MKSLKKRCQAALPVGAIDADTLYDIFGMFGLFDLPEVGKAAKTFLMDNWKELTGKGVVKRLVDDYPNLVTEAVQENVKKNE